jgi:hypothetical protein
MTGLTLASLSLLAAVPLAAAPPAKLSAVSLSPTSVTGGQPSTGTVTLSAAAPAGGFAVSLACANPAFASVPSAVTVAAGATTAPFPVTTYAVSSRQTVAISATSGSTTKSATLTLLASATALSSLSVTPDVILGGGKTEGRVWLTAPAPPGGVAVSLSSSSPSVNVPATVTVPESWSVQPFEVTSSAVAADGSALLSASLDAVTKTASLTLVAELAVTLASGPGPVLVSTSTVAVAGTLFPASAGDYTSTTGTTVVGRLGDQTVTAVARPDGFTLPGLSLSSGSNVVTVTATHAPTGKVSAPATVTYVVDTTAPTAKPRLLTSVPEPVRGPDVSFSGTIDGFQGLDENAFVEVTPGGQKLDVAADGSWSGALNLPNGRSQISFRVVDRAGNRGNPESHLWYVQVGPLLPIFSSFREYFSGGGAAWPGSLDVRFLMEVQVAGQAWASLKGAHVDIYLDEPGGGTASPVSCPHPNDALGCLVERKPAPDLSVDVTGTTANVLFPPLRTGLHNIRFVVRDSFGDVSERGGTFVVGPGCSCTFSDGGTGWYIPSGVFAMPGVVTTQAPKLAGRVANGNAPIDCGDSTGPAAPAISYWNPKGGGSWSTLPVRSARNVDGTFEALPDTAGLPQGKVPVTTNASGQKVLRFRLEQKGGSIFTATWREYGRRLCDGSASASTSLHTRAIYSGGDPTTGEVVFDLPYRSPSKGDGVSPVVETPSASASTFTTDDDGPFSTRLLFRVTDLNGDLDYLGVDVTPPGCASPACSFPARLVGDQQLTSAAPGGWFAAEVGLSLGTNDYTVTARDDAGNTGTATITLTRLLTPVVARITSPTTNGGTYGLLNPRVTTFDASESLNRTDPPSPLRFQWTKPRLVSGGVTTWELVSSAPTYSEYLSYSWAQFRRRRVIVSSSAIPAPNPTIEAPCASAPAGQCSVAEVTYNVTCAPDGSLAVPARIVSPASGATFGLGAVVTLVGTAGDDANPLLVYRWDLVNTATGRSFALPQAPGAAGDGYANANRVLSVDLATLAGLTEGGYQLTLSAGQAGLTGSCVQAVGTATAALTVQERFYEATGLAPGALVPGTTSLTLYGTGFDAAALVAVAGPAYSLEDRQTRLCDPAASECATQTFTPAASADGSSLVFSLPGSFPPGIYLVWAADPAGPTSNGLWLEVQSAEATAPRRTRRSTGSRCR